MADKLFKAKVFVVEVPLDDNKGQLRFPGSATFENIIRQVDSYSIGQRVKWDKERFHRLSGCVYDNGCWLLNFETSEFTGPGRFRPDVASVPIDLSPDESFSYETAMLYDPKESLVFLETVSIGMGPGAIECYFSGFVDDISTTFRLIPRLDEEATSRARQHQRIRAVTAHVNIGPVSSADHDAGLGVLQAFGQGFESETISVEIKASRLKRSTLSVPKVWEFISQALGFAEQGDLVTQLKVRGKVHDDDILEEVDLLGHQAKMGRTLSIDPVSRKIHHKARWSALLDFREEFLA